MSTLTSYVINDVDILNIHALKPFLYTFLPRNILFYSLKYDDVNKIVTIYTKEPSYSTETFNILTTSVKTKYPNLPVQTPIQSDTSNDFISSPSVYGYFPQVSTIDGSALISSNLSLTRNMYYTDLTINSGVTLNTNGWRIVITGTLTLNGTIANDGSDASGIIAGVGSAPIYTTYLGTGTAGGEGLTRSNSGVPGVSALYQCAGGAGGKGGDTFDTYVGGSGGSIIPISNIDGGIETLSTMPIAFLGRLISNNYYIMGGTGGGSGGCNKKNASIVRSGAGGGAGGFIIVAAKTIVGNGSITAKGGNGSSATFSVTGNQSPGGIGGGGGGGGGCIIVITQGTLPATITLNVKGGIGGSGVAPGVAGSNGSDGNTFITYI